MSPLTSPFFIALRVVAGKETEATPKKAKDPEKAPDASQEQAEAQEHLDQVQADWSAQQADLVSERDELQGELAEIEQARDVLLLCVDAGDLTAYEALRRRKGGIAVVQLRDGACGGCGVAISPSLEWQLRQGGLVNCSNCERILVRV